MHKSTTVSIVYYSVPVSEPLYKSAKVSASICMYNSVSVSKLMYRSALVQYSCVAVSY